MNNWVFLQVLCKMVSDSQLIQILGVCDYGNRRWCSGRAQHGWCLGSSPNIKNHCCKVLEGASLKTGGIHLCISCLNLSNSSCDGSQHFLATQLLHVKLVVPGNCKISFLSCTYLPADMGNCSSCTCQLVKSV